MTHGFRFILHVTYKDIYTIWNYIGLEKKSVKMVNWKSKLYLEKVISNVMSQQWHMKLNADAHFLEIF